MDSNERGSLPSDLVRGRARFQAWRARRAPGERIPQTLWTLAVRLAETNGVSRTATALGLDYYRLRKRADTSVTAPPPSGGLTFVEFTTPPLVARQCQMELDNGSGATMRVQLIGYDAADIAALTRGFWSDL
jgi:hypothetical protein